MHPAGVLLSDTKKTEMGKSKGTENGIMTSDNVECKGHKKIKKKSGWNGSKGLIQLLIQNTATVVMRHFLKLL